MEIPIDHNFTNFTPKSILCDRYIFMDIAKRGKQGKKMNSKFPQDSFLSASNTFFHKSKSSRNKFCPQSA